MTHGQSLGCRIEPRRECLGGCGLVCTRLFLEQRPNVLRVELSPVAHKARLRPVPGPVVKANIPGLDFGEEADWRNYLTPEPGSWPTWFP